VRLPLTLALLASGVWLALPACSSSSSGGSSGTTPSPDAGTTSSLSPDGTPPACSGAPGGGPLPSARGDVGGALDPTGRRMVIFGGDVAVPVCGQVIPSKFDAETWVLDVACGTWRQVPGDGPSARSRGSMVADPTHGRALYFGGRSRAGTSGAYTLYDEVWAFDFATEAWAKLDTTGTGPTPRANAAVAVDGSSLVVFGGNTSTDGLAFKPQNDAYVLDLDALSWSAIGSAPKPPARLFHAMAIDPTSHVAYTWSGGDEQAFTGPFLKDMWSLDLASGTWSKVATTGDEPVARINFGMMIDPTASALVIFGGHDDGQLGNENDVYRFDLATSAWSRAPGGDTFNKPSTSQCDFPADFTTLDTAGPERRSAFAFAPRADGRAFVAAFGKSDCGVVADAWWWSAGPSSWKALRENPAGLSCLRFSTTCTGLCN
jgi:hypothetical protein